MIGKLIKEKRQEKGLSSRGLAEKSGVSQAYISQLENGHFENPSIDVLRKLASPLGIDSLDVNLMNQVPIKTELGEYLRKIRKENKKTLVQLANETGLSHSYLSQVENGKKTNPSMETLKKVAEACNRSYLELWEVAGYASIDVPVLTPLEKEQLIRQLYEIYASTESEAVETIMANTIDFINGR